MEIDEAYSLMTHLGTGLLCERLPLVAGKENGKLTLVLIYKNDSSSWVGLC